ncbi:MAG TPA: DUF922 domain-containing protein [Chitinophagaceae bacterium]
MPPFIKYFFLLLLPLSAISQDKNEELIEWDASSKLSWADYKAKADVTTDAAAITTTYLSLEYNVNQQGFNYKIQCRFSKNRSWGIHKTAYILSHEQGHFDIAEVYARKLHKAMSEYQFNKRTFQQDLKKIYEEIMSEKEEMQNQYDEETNHSIRKDRQAEWLKKIADLLSAYEDYADYKYL